MPLDIGTISFGLAAFCFTALLGAQIRIWKWGVSSMVLLVATAITLAWSLFTLLESQIPVRFFYISPALEALKTAAWFSLLLSILGLRKVLFERFRDPVTNNSFLFIAILALSLPALLLAYTVFAGITGQPLIFFPDYGGQLVLSGFLITSVAGLALLEQVVRNTRHQHQWHLKFLCLGLGILFSFDVYLYSNAILFDRIDSLIWDIRGIITAMASPLIALGVLRTRNQPLQVNISRRLVFHTSVLFAAGVYLLLMSVAGFYLRSLTSQWGLLLQVMFWVLSLSLLFVLMYSVRIRTAIKLYIDRHLFSSRYDYRDEWMRISNTLSQSSLDDSLPVRCIIALASIVNSPAGALWYTLDDEHYDQAAQLEMGWITGSSLTRQDPLIQHLETTNELMELNNLRGDAGAGLLPQWLLDDKRAWLLIPLVLREKLLGFVLLREPAVELDLNWEDYDLFKAAGQQSASYLAQMIASDSLAETRQFSAFNQVSAFVVHDIKTLTSQLSMMVKNSSQFRDNPEFFDDMILTTEHAINKLNELLKHFRKEESASNPLQENSENFDLACLVEDVVASKTRLRPIPKLTILTSGMELQGNKADIRSAIGHLVQNAQEATDDSGEISIVLDEIDGFARLAITDTGLGMDEEFIHTRLFRPFESTKGLTGMGIGVFQSRALIRKLGGELSVESQPGEGSTFTILLPIFEKTEEDLAVY